MDDYSCEKMPLKTPCGHCMCEQCSREIVYPNGGIGSRCPLCRRLLKTRQLRVAVDIAITDAALKAKLLEIKERRQQKQFERNLNKLKTDLKCMVDKFVTTAIEDADRIFEYNMDRLARQEAEAIAQLATVPHDLSALLDMGRTLVAEGETYNEPIPEQPLFHPQNLEIVQSSISETIDAFQEAMENPDADDADEEQEDVTTSVTSNQDHLNAGDDTDDDDYDDGSEDENGDEDEDDADSSEESVADYDCAHSNEESVVDDD